MEIRHVQTEKGGAFRAFETEEPYRQMGEMTYLRHSDNIITIDHTLTFKGFEGMGVGTRLVKAGIAYATAESIKIRPLCPFVKAYMEKFPELQTMIAV